MSTYLTYSFNILTVSKINNLGVKTEGFVCSEIQREMLQLFENFVGEKKTLGKSLFPVLTTSLPTSAFLWLYCLNGGTYRSGEYCSDLL